MLIGPLEKMAVPGLHVNSFGVIPNRGKWRLIVDLSHPQKQSINDGVLKEYCSLT